MNGNHDLRIVAGNNHPEPAAFDLANIPPVASCICFYPQRVLHNELRIRLGQLPLSKFVLRVPGEVHGPLRAGTCFLSPSGARNADFESATVNRGGRAAGAVEGDGDGQHLAH